MIDNKKEQERDELHRTIWNMANDLRGSVDGWDFKQYVLGMLFYRYISENFVKFVNAGELEADNKDFDYAMLEDEAAEEAREDLVQSKGYFILPSQLFCNVKEKALNNENLNETLESVFRNIESSAQGHDSEDDFKGLFDDIDVNSNKLGGTVAKRNEKLVKLLNGVAENSYNLSVSSYVEQEDTREKIDIVKLNADIKEIVAREEKLRAEIDKIIEEIEVDEK